MEVLERSLDQHASVPNIVRLSRARLPDGTLGALNVVGDVHGQFPDFCLLFEEQLGGGLPNSRGNRFVFNGDLVDRGAMGLEIVLSVLLMKLLCGPDAVTVLRGNHETTSMNKVKRLAAPQINFSTILDLHMDSLYVLCQKYTAF